MPTDTDHISLIRSAVLDEDSFLRLTMTAARGAESPWVKVTVRPVRVRGQRRLQFSYFDSRKDITKNYDGDAASAKLDEALAMPFSQFHVQSRSGDLHVRVTRKGRVLIGRGKASRPEHQPSLAHDREKPHLISANDSFLHAIGIADAAGKLRPSRAAKFHQINEFLRLMDQVLGPLEAGGALEIVDCGCGNAYLTFAAYHYLRDVRGAAVHVVGVDVNGEVISNATGLRDSLGWEGLDFRVSRIGDYHPERPPDLVLSLHACDTATDEAIAQGILWGSRVILAAPCCQHELQTQIKAAVMRPVLRHGILKERTADILTDAFRALILRIMGYRTDVVQFVSPEHTTKNLMIRAVKGLKAGERRFVEEYEELKRFWEVEPVLEGMVGEQLRQALRAS
jgi:SAM-dependent methyltransferase